jgi:hypothetical protein
MSDNQITIPPRQNWRIATRGASRGLYALAIVDIKKFENITTAGSPYLSEIVRLKDHEFVFNMNPRSLDLEEPAAVMVVPTQGGGQFIEHQGQIYKNVHIAGTTGLRPNKKSTIPGIIPIPPAGIPSPFDASTDAQTLLPKGESTGFDDFIRLRNVFRNYFHLKSDAITASRWVMIWQNGKEGEFYIVEPMSFRTRRDSSNPLTMQYDIVLRTIQRADLSMYYHTDDRRKRTAIQALNERLTNLTNEIAAAFRVTEGLIDNVVSIGQATINNVLGPARAVLGGLQGVTTAYTRAFSVPRNSIALLARDAIDLSEALMSANTAYQLEGVLTQDVIAAFAYKTLGIQMGRLYAEDSLFDESISQKFDDRTTAYNSPTSGFPATGGSPLSMQNTAVPTTTGTATITSYDTIFTLAQRLLADQGRWKEIVVLNGLKAPYISETGDGIDVLRPGDTVLFPAPMSVSQSGVEQDASDADPLTKRLGRDLRLVSYQAFGGFEDFDLAVNQRGDIALIEGQSNLEQAVRIKFSTEQGTLPTHPQFGVRAPIGSKVNIRSLIGFQLNARASLLQDNRIDEINDLRFAVEGNVLTVKATLQIAEIDGGVAVSFQSRR